MITKMGSDFVAPPSASQEEIELAQNLLAGGGVVGGGALARRQLKDGNLTGRRTLYHGTVDAKAKQSILREGLRQTTDANAINTRVLKAGSPDVYKKSLGKVYLTPSAYEAGMYSEGARARRVAGPAYADNYLKNYIKRDTIVKANVPLWKMTTVRNPETEMGFKAWKAKVYPNTPAALVRGQYNVMDRAVVIPGNLPMEYTKGTSKYKGLGRKELFSYLRNKPGRALKGAGLVGAGIVAAGLGARHLAKRYFGRKAEVV